MVTASPSSRRTTVTTGTLSARTLSRIATTRPFTRQIDIVFPANVALERALSAVKTQYVSGRECRLADVVDSGLASGSDVVFLGTSSGADRSEGWSIENGVLSLTLNKDTYERVGLVGTKQVGNKGSDRYFVRVDLRDRTTKTFVCAKAAFRTWDDRRETDGSGLWNVKYFMASQQQVKNVKVKNDDTLVEVKATNDSHENVHVPVPAFQAYPQSPSNNTKRTEIDNNELETWFDNMSELFEWVGMASLGAQRLRAHERVDSYIALYDPPEPSRVGDIVHFRWKGLLSPAFVQSIIDIAVVPSVENQETFVGITAHAHVPSFAGCVPSHGGARVGDSWCLILAHDTNGPEDKTAWALADSSYV